MKHYWVFITLLVFILALVPQAFANSDQFNVTVCPSVPYYVGFVYSQPVYLTAYSFNSSIDLAWDNWSIYGSNDGHTFYQFDNHSYINFTANTTQMFNLSCGYVYFQYYIIKFDNGFAGCPLVTIIFYSQNFPPLPAGSGTPKEIDQTTYNSLLVVAGSGIVYLTIIVGLLYKKRRKKQRDTHTRDRILT